MTIPVLLAKFLSAGAVAQAATGATVVVVAFTGAGATGVLGDDVKDTLTTVVGVTDESTQDAPAADATLADATTDPGDVAGPDGGTSVAVDAVDEVEAAAAWAEGPDAGDYTSFGQWVSTAAGDKAMRAELERMGYRFSELVRSHAQDKGMTDDELQSELDGEGIELEEPIDGTTEVAPDTATEVQKGAAQGRTATQSGTGTGTGKATGTGNGTGKATGTGTTKANGNSGSTGPGSGNAGGNGRGNG